MRRIFTLPVVIGLSLCLLTAVGTDAQPPKLKVGLPSVSMYSVVPRVAQDLGYFEREGVALEILHFETGVVNAKALLARAVDLADVDTALILSAAAAGADLRMIGTYAQNLHYGLYTTKDVQSLRDLYGRRFAIPGVGGLGHVVLLALLNEANLDPGQIQMVPVGGTAARLKALLAGKVQATAGEFSPQVEADPKLHRLLIVSESLPKFMGQALAVYADTLETKRDAVERFQLAMVKATRWAYGNKAEFLAAAAKHVPGTAEELARVYDFYVKARVWAINGELEPERVAYMQKLGLETKTQAKAVDLTRLAPRHEVDRIASKVGRVAYP